MIHELKCWVEPLREIRSGRKTFELRRDDRPYAVGDTLRLRQWDPERGEYVGVSYTDVEVTHLMREETFGLPPGYVIMSIGKPHPLLDAARTAQAEPSGDAREAADDFARKHLSAGSSADLGALAAAFEAYVATRVPVSPAPAQDGLHRSLVAIVDDAYRVVPDVPARLRGTLVGMMHDAAKLGAGALAALPAESPAPSRDAHDRPLSVRMREWASPVGEFPGPGIQGALSVMADEVARMEQALAALPAVTLAQLGERWPRGSLAEEISRIVHAFPDKGRKDDIRALADRVAALERSAALPVVTGDAVEAGHLFWSRSGMAPNLEQVDQLVAAFQAHGERAARAERERAASIAHARGKFATADAIRALPPAEPPPATRPVCEPWCGTKSPNGNCIVEPAAHCWGSKANGCLCSSDCMTAGRPLNPPPVAPPKGEPTP